MIGVGSSGPVVRICGEDIDLAEQERILRQCSPLKNPVQGVLDRSGGEIGVRSPTRVEREQLEAVDRGKRKRGRPRSDDRSAGQRSSSSSQREEGETDEQPWQETPAKRGRGRPPGSTKKTKKDAEKASQVSTAGTTSQPSTSGAAAPITPEVMRAAAVTALERIGFTREGKRIES